jgi:cell division septation protein DedD
MADHDARMRRGAHRTRRDPLRVIAPLALLFAAAVAAVIVFALQQGPDTVRTTAPVGSPLGRTPAKPATPAPATTPGGAATGSASPGSPSAQPSPSTSVTPSASPDPAGFDIDVVVLNATERVGLGGRLASRLRSVGWTVPVIRNFEGELAATTVYYPAGKRAAAEAVVRDVPGGARVAERFGNLSRTRLTVVIGEDYPR